MDTLSEKQLKELRIFLGKLNGDYMTKEQFAKFFKLVMGVLQISQKQLEKAEGKVYQACEISEKASELTHEKLEAFEARINALKLKEGRDGKDGKSVDFNEVVEAVLELMPTPEAGKDADEGFIIESIEKKLPFLSESIRNALELLQGEERLDKKAIKGIEELEADIKELKNRKLPTVINGGVSGRDLIKDIDLSAQLDGVTKTFNIQAIWNVVSINLQSYPYGALRKGIDYTWTPTSITFTDTIDASTQLAAGQACILTVVQG